MNEWINVQDKLPDKSGDYLIFCCNHNFVTISYFRGKSQWAKYNDCITHWMLLPDTPDKSKN